MKILGLSAFYHDSAACLVVDGNIVAAAQEERFSRKKNDAGFPADAIRFCCHQGGISPAQLDHVVFYDKPFLKFERILETYLAFAPRGFKGFAASAPVWLQEKLFQKRNLADFFAQHFGTNTDLATDWTAKLLFSEHHLSHAASAFFPSPFEEAAVLTMDGVGEWATTSLAIGKGASLQVLKEIHFPHSLGLLYSAFTSYTGFKVNSGEYKLMGLAPYGQPRYADLIRQHLIDIQPDGSFHLDLRYFEYCTGLSMTNARFHRLFGGPPRQPESLLTQRHMDLAASVQAVTQEVLLKLARDIAKSTGQKNLCLAGGVALNCVANGLLQREGLFEQIWVQPAAGDAGGAVGAALAVHHGMLQQPRRSTATDSMQGAYLGPAYTQEEIENTLKAAGAIFSSHAQDEMVEHTAVALADGKAVGWHQGRMEFGPRALGARSILADPRSPTVQQQLNLKVKYRESFRPFAPSVLWEDASEWFQVTAPSPYMQVVAPVALAQQLPVADGDAQLFGLDKLALVRSTISAVTHVDFSARVQTVHHETNPLFHRLLTRFKALTGCAVLVNTSFNIRGEPIVCTPQDALRCWMGTEIEWLVIGNSILRKEDQPHGMAGDYRHLYGPD